MTYDLCIRGLSISTFTCNLSLTMSHDLKIPEVLNSLDKQENCQGLYKMKVLLKGGYVQSAPASSPTKFLLQSNVVSS